MSTAADGTPREPGADATPAELEADIARTRRELGDTVGALSEKLNPKAQAEHQMGHLKEQAGHQVEHLKEQAGHQVERARHAAQSAVGRLRGHGADATSDPDGPEGDRAAIAGGMARAHGADDAPSTHGAAGVPGAPAGAVVPDPDAAAARAHPQGGISDPDAVVLAEGTRPGGNPWIAMSIGATLCAGIGALLLTRRR